MVDSSSWFRRYRPLVQPGSRLVCFPHAGGSASFFRSWSSRLPDDVEVLAVQYPGRQDRLREPCIERMDDLAEEVTGALLPFLDRPYALFGHSMGASVAHEVAARLENRHGHPPQVLFVSGRLPPRHQQPQDRYFDDEAILDDVRTLDPAHLTVLDDPDMRDLVLPVIRADYQLVDSYRPSPASRVGVPVVAYAGTDDSSVPVWQVGAWSDITTSTFEMAVFPGSHFYLRSGEAALVDDILRRLERARAKVTAGPQPSPGRLQSVDRDVTGG